MLSCALFALLKREYRESANSAEKEGTVPMADDAEDEEEDMAWDKEHETDADAEEDEDGDDIA